MKHGKAYVIKSRRKSSRGAKRPGARKGHKPHFRPMPDHIDVVRRVPIDVCPHCGCRELGDKVQEVRSHVYEEIPPVRPVVVKLDIERRYCRRCKKLVEQPVDEVLPGGRCVMDAMNPSMDS